jgi:uncharacterized lipoprotein YbaY
MATQDFRPGSRYQILTIPRDGVALGQKEDTPKKARLTGAIQFDGEARFEASTVARVTLQDVSLADAPAKPIGEQVIKDLMQFPIPFKLEYAGAAIDKGHTYAVHVRIETGGRLDYLNDTSAEAASGG